jgi:hypothetical protein
MKKENSKPNPDLKKLERLIGTWQLSGDTHGTVTYQWLEDFFLVQHFDIHVFGNHIKGMEVIGHLQPFGQQPEQEIRSRSYDNAGNTLDFVYEMEQDELIIWGGEKGSPAYFRGKFSDDGNINTGAWVYPNGGYKSVMTKLK